MVSFVKGFDTDPTKKKKHVTIIWPHSNGLNKGAIGSKSKDYMTFQVALLSRLIVICEV